MEEIDIRNKNSICEFNEFLKYPCSKVVDGFLSHMDYTQMNI